jgi:hypothetical protein
MPPKCSGNGFVKTAGCINTNHRKIVTYRKFDTSNYNDYFQGHGTHVAGSVAGNAVGTTAAHAEARLYNGAAPGAKIAFDDVGDSSGSLTGIPYDLYEGLFPHSYAAGARLHSNSWGIEDSYYDTMSMEIDEFTYDNDDFLVLVAAGNAGPMGYTVGAPATAKNILSVGASQNARPPQGPDHLQISWSNSTAFFAFEPATFGASLSSGSVWSGDIVNAIPLDACSSLSTPVTGKIVLISRGVCEFGTKALNAQDAGARGVVVYNNVAGESIGMMAGSHGGQVTVPTMMIGLDAGLQIAQALSSFSASVVATFPVASTEEEARNFAHHVIADFSSRGPTSDLRIKPDVLCPGSGITSAFSDGDVTSKNCGAWATMEMSGTSMAAPLCAGAAALVREYLTKGYWYAGVPDTSKAMKPSAALVKAVMIHAAQPVKSDQASPYIANYPNVASGYGRVDLSSALAFEDSGFQGIYRDDGSVSQAGMVCFCFLVQGSAEHYVSDGSSRGELKVSLVWTDPAGDPLSSRILINDLDLQVFGLGTSEHYLGNNLTQSDETHTGYMVRDSNGNTEQVRIKNAPTGYYTARVLGIDVPIGPQRFALVASAAKISVKNDSACPGAPACANACSGRGTCLQAQGVCVCPITHGGSDCSRGYKTLGSTAGTVDSLRITALGAAYYTFVVHHGGGFELRLSSSTAPATDADFFISRGRLPTDSNFDASIADQYSSGVFAGSGSGTWVLKVLSWSGNLRVDASLTILQTGLGAAGEVEGISGGGGGGGGGGSGSSNCTVSACKCGLFTSATGSISDGDGDYPDNAECWWIIAPLPAHNVSVIFTGVEFEEDYDFLLVYACQDVWCQQKTLTWTHTGYVAYKEVHSSTGIVLILMATDQAIFESGFTAEWRTTNETGDEGGGDESGGGEGSDDGSGDGACTAPCHCQLLSAPQGSFSDGSFDANYGDGANCRWIIAPPPVSETPFLVLQFSELDVEEGFDFVTINECSGLANVSTPAPRSVTISGTALCTSSITGTYTYLQETEDRPSYASADNSKLLYFSPKGRQYGIWRWVIGGTLGLDGNTLAYVDSNATDVSMIVEMWKEYCNDAWTSSTGMHVSATYTDYTNSLPTCQDPVTVAVVSGYDTGDALKSMYHSSSTGIMEVQFTSDGSTNSDGFAARWELRAVAPMSCSKPCDCREFVLPQGIFSDGSGDAKYSNDADCLWKILSPSSLPVHLTFTRFQTELEFDYVEIYGCNVPSCAAKTLLASLSGSPDLNNTYVAPTGMMLINFKSDSSIALSGWEAVYKSGQSEEEEEEEEEFTWPPALPDLHNCSLPGQGDWSGLYAYRPHNITSGGLGLRMIPAQFEIWLCHALHPCARSHASQHTLAEICKEAGYIPPVLATGPHHWAALEGCPIVHTLLTAAAVDPFCWVYAERHKRFVGWAHASVVGL